jgi:hypothetical protein
MMPPQCALHAWHRSKTLQQQHMFRVAASVSGRSENKNMQRESLSTSPQHCMRQACPVLVRRST